MQDVITLLVKDNKVITPKKKKKKKKKKEEKEEKEKKEEKCGSVTHTTKILKKS